ncbi:hypothetical protein BH24ACT6_BH24ACT6_01690 [soil metagenome]
MCPRSTGSAVCTCSVSTPTPFDIDVHRDGGFDAPITIAVDRRYMRIWDENGLYPTPSAEHNTATEVVWEFDPPAGDDLHVTNDGGSSRRCSRDGRAPSP